ncbi:DUF5819 family protein [Streptantibioticus parmotrematis]|uniref:DUF5819 family protein n=1 Tax=Streptantibioticus parmotrematis TaxID=2873249 RepID=UPI00340AAC57
MEPPEEGAARNGSGAGAARDRSADAGGPDAPARAGEAGDRAYAPGERAATQGGPKEGTPAQGGPEETADDSRVSAGTASGEAASARTASGEAASARTAPGEVASAQIASGEAASAQTAPVETASGVPEAGRPDADDTGHPSDLGPIARLSLPSRVVVALTVAAVVVGAAVHLGMVFLSVAPSNTISKAHASAINGYVDPEFEQNWQLFAPNPVQVNTDVQARAEVRQADGTVSTTGWVDFTAMDLAKIRHNPIPSHTEQNELRRAWGFYTDTHDEQDHPIGDRGDLSQEYLLRIIAHRFGPHLNGGSVQRIQVRLATMPVAAPKWSAERIDTQTTYRVMSWWTVSPKDFT